MIRRREFALAGLSAAALAAWGSANERPLDPSRDHEAMFDNCAKICSDCQRLCAACATYCGKALLQGGEHHFDTLMSCLDSADLCSAAASLAARQGPSADLACRACADSCARCAVQCETHGRNDAVMSRCAEECRKCETACREML